MPSSLRYLITRANADVWLAEAGQVLLADIIVLYRRATRHAVLGDALCERVMGEFLRRLERRTQPRLLRRA